MVTDVFTTHAAGSSTTPEGLGASIVYYGQQEKLDHDNRKPER